MSNTRALLTASNYAFGPYGNGNGNKLPMPTHEVLEGIDTEFYLSNVTGLSKSID